MRPTNANPVRKILFIAVMVIVSIAVIVAILELLNVTHFLHSAKPAVSGNSYTKGEATGQATANTSKGTMSGSSNGNNGQPGDQKSNNGGADTHATLLRPSGDFVSNHHPNLSGSPAPNTMTSVCTTTPGVVCTISFTKDNVTKSLQTQITDRGGSAYWNWKLQDIALTPGNWQIKATATLNGKSLSTTDAMQLVVAQ